MCIVSESINHTYEFNIAFQCVSDARFSEWFYILQNEFA